MKATFVKFEIEYIFRNINNWKLSQLKGNAQQLSLFGDFD